MVATTPGVTFLFTDIEGSTRLWETEPARMADALARHDRLCRVAVENHGGRLVKMLGDGLHAVFSDPAAAVASVLELQRGMAEIAKDCGIPFKMRCGLNAGESELRDGDFFGSAVNRAARIAGAAHGGQILLSQTIVDLGKGRFPEGTDLLYLGRVRLRDLSGSEDIWQLLHATLLRTFAPLRSLDSAPNNLPQQLTSFIGREKEIAEIRKLLGSARLLTFIGAGGCGKTRLALQVAADLLDSYPDGVWLAELAALVDAGLVAQTVANVLGLREEPNRTLTETLAEYLKSRHLLLLLDNAEHVLGTCAHLADLVLRQCPSVLMLVTSRERLGIGGELTYRAPSLSIPDPKQDTTPEHLSQYESVRLFVERAQFQLPRFAITRQNAPALASVCYRLDGIPLALELAAARMRSMSVEEVDRRLDYRFGLLKGGSRTAPPRQQTLRSLIDWSYDFLNPAEKSLLSRLAVLYGDWALEAAEQVCSGEGVEQGQVFDLLTSLVDKSLVGAEQRNGATRYRQLETVRQYGQERLRERAELTDWQGRHLAYFLKLAEEAAVGMRGAEQQVWLDRLETVHDNLRAALTYSSASGGDAASGLQLAGALSRFWEVRGYVGEGRGWLATLLPLAPGGQAAAARARALNAAGVLARAQGDYPAARAFHEESLAIRRELGDRAGIAGALNNLGLAAYDRGDYRAAQELLEDSLAILHELGDQRGAALALTNLGNVAYEQHEFKAAQAQLEESLRIFREVESQWGIALALTNLGDVVCGRGDYPAARGLLEESLAISRQLGDRERIAHSLNILGKVTYEQGGYLVARTLHMEGLAIMRELGDRWGMAWSLEGLAVAFALAVPRRAACVWGQAERLREEIGAPLPPSERPRYDRYVAVARAAIGDTAAFDLGWQEGRAMKLEHAMEYALKGQDA